MNRWILILSVCFVISQVGYCYPRKFCPPLKIKNGRIKNRPRTFAQFVCNKGYILAGDRYSKCTQGVWETPPPVCVRPNCQRVTSLKNGLIFPSHRSSVLNFYCAANYTLVGSKLAYCLDMKWSTHLPSCLSANAMPSMSCDFEREDLCGWSHDLNHNFDWIRRTNRTPSWHVGTGPTDDHTKGPGGNGYYMYVEATTRNVNDTARLISPVYNKALNNSCLEFYYHMYGSGMGQLKVYVKKISGSWDLNEDKIVYSRSGNYGNQWNMAYVLLGIIDEEFQIIFEGVRGISYVSDLAIDDVKLIEDCTPTSSAAVTDVESDTSTIVYEYCTNRCNKTRTADMSCSCQEDCFDNSDCCPDYIQVCFSDTDTDMTDYTTEEDAETTTDIIEETYTTVSATQPEFVISKVINVTNITKISQSPKIIVPRPITISATSSTPIPLTTAINTSNNNSSQIMPLSPIYSKSTVTWKSSFFHTSTSSKPITVMQPLITSTQPVRTTVRLARPNLTTQTKYTKISLENDMATLPNEETIDDTDFNAELPKEIEKEYPPDSTPRILLSDKVAPVTEQRRPDNKTTVVAVLTVCFIVFVVLGVIFAAKRYTNRSCASVRRMRSGNGDSQSDVRFLTSDEILDFTLAKSFND